MTVELTVREGPGDHLPRFEAVPNETAELAMLAQRITAALQSGRVHLISAAERAAEIGAVLIRAQELVPRGQWQKWVEENTDLAVPTAREYMRIARSDTAASVRTIRAFRALGASQKELPDGPPRFHRICPLL